MGNRYSGAVSRIYVIGIVAALVAAVLAVLTTAPPAARADTAPPPGTPATVSADALPTVQQNGVVWAEATVGNTVYAVGSFSQTWPAGTTASSTNQTPRANLLAFDITTGNLTSFNHSLNAQALAVSASPDGSRVYVGGDFTTVDGQTRNHIAAFITATGALDPNFHPSVSGQVAAIAATNSTVYFGGNFSNVAGVARGRLAATTTSGALLNWAPTADDNFVSAMVLTPDGSRVIVGGRFSTLSHVNTYGLGAVDAITGATLPFAINQTVRDYGAKCGILSLTTDGTQIYGSGFAYGCGNFEGTFAADPDTGNIVWVNDCHGDTYGTFPMGQVLYSVSHAHDCGALGQFPDTTNPRVWHHALAFTTYPTGTNVGPDTYGWNYSGVPDSTLLHWYPALGIGSITGAAQAAWAVTGNGKYIALGGEFPTANGKAQQGLVRYALHSIAPNKVGPVSTSTITPSVVSLSSGTVRVAWQATWDYDNQTLTYNVLRDGVQIYSTTQASDFWALQSMGYVDTGLVPGSSHKYKVQVVDPDNNQITSSSSAAVTVSASQPSAYAAGVLQDGASDFWRLGEASGTTGYDWAGYSDLTEGSAVAHGRAGAIIGDTDNASVFDGTDASQSSPTAPITGPNTFTIETWINTTTTSGGKIVGFGNAAAGTLSGSYDRHIYMDNGGHLVFGVYNNGTYTASTPGSYNDGQWHQVVATLSSAGMVLYVDGKRVGTNKNTMGQPFSGYWRIGGDNLNGWPSRPSSNDFAGAIDDVAIYPTALTLSQVQTHYTNSGRTLNVPTRPTDSYGQAVYGDNPDLYWRLDDAAGPTAVDQTPNGDDGSYQGGISYRTPSTVTGPNGTGVTLNGSTGLIVASQSVDSPSVYSEELWFNTTTTRGGKLIGFGDAQTGNSNNYDRHVYMLNSGQLQFGTWTGQTNTVTSPAAYNDGKWHYLVAEQGPDGMSLYVDSKLIGTNPQTQAQPYTGYWRVGGDNTWGGADSNYFAGTVDEVAVYHTVLSSAQIRTHWRASAAAVNQPPTASLTATCTGLTCAVDGSASSDADGSIAGYAWDFGDGRTATGATASHTYASPGSYTVTLTVTDDQNATGVATRTVSVKALPADAYGRAVVQDGPALYWRLDDANGPTAADQSSNNDSGVYSGGVSFQTPSTVTGANGTGITTDGSSGGVGSSQTFDNPTVYSEEVWFNTTTTAGGKLIGFGDRQSGYSSNYDRHIWMSASGQLNFGVWTGQANVVTSPNSYNDGRWHFAVATQGPDGMDLYVDGVSVGTNPQSAAQPYTGYWRIGGDTSWGDSSYFAGSLDEAAVFGYELTAAQVQNEYGAASTTPNQNPNAAFTSSCTKLACSFDGSGSADPDGTVAAYSWDFGDGTTGAGVNPAHTYAAAGTYHVTLTVTDNHGGTGTVAHDVNPVANVAPVAAFTPSCTNLSCSFDGSGSSDPDGSVAAYAWDFGDNGSGSGATATHSFASAGTYTVRLTVTDNDGATTTVSHDVTVTAAPNTPPTASFTATCTNLSCSFDGSASADPDGSIATYAWNFGDGTSGTGVTPPAHAYPVAGDYSVVLTVTDNRGATTSQTRVVSPRPAANPSTAPFATDGFNRTVTGGFGTADTGGAWTATGNKANLSVSGGVASINMPSATAGPGALLNSVSVTDAETDVTMTANKSGTGNGVNMSVIGRHVSTNNEYRARVRLQSTNAIGLAITELNNSATETVLGKEITLPGVTFAPGMQLKVRFQVTGTSPTTLRLKVWPATSAEPTAWQLSTTDAAAGLQAAGSVGVASYLSGSATNAPVTMQISAFVSKPTVAPPTASFTATCTNRSCTADGSASTDPSGTVSSYAWSWGDGTVTAGATSTHTYAAAGTYRITLTVTDPSGWTDVTTRSITVQ